MNFERDWIKSLKYRIQQKQEWSEEDKEMWAEISDLLWEGYKQSSSKFSWDDIRNWLNPKLKSIRPQNRCGWNDMSVKPIYPCDILYQQPNGNIFIYRYIEGGRANDAQTPTFCNLDENGKWIYLKDVKPQNTWKPSEEQIRVLNEVINHAAESKKPHWNDYIFGTLNNLIRQLKKLKE